MTPRPSPYDRAIAKTAVWRQDLAKALGTTRPLAEITALSLERAIHHFHLSPDPDAWVWATVCGAELARRQSPYDRSLAGMHTAAELAWREQKERRAAA